METTLYKLFNLEDILPTISYVHSIDVKSSQEKYSDTNPSTYDEEIDLIIQRDYLEDVDLPDNQTEEEKINRIKRYQRIVKELKKKHDYKCQVCGYNFLIDNGNYYCEAHHIKSLSQGGSQSPENVVILCPNHHRLFHYATNNVIIKSTKEGKRVMVIGDKEVLLNEMIWSENKLWAYINLT
ncbi:HNH endonuclease [Anaerocolumna cellulosilytica]|nr:HNH endonuclease signature motif containing protein [Anaerocolumna cellulosilytica]